jgi:hypothetical protein
VRINRSSAQLPAIKSLIKPAFNNLARDATVDTLGKNQWSRRPLRTLQIALNQIKRMATADAQDARYAAPDVAVIV